MDNQLMRVAGYALGLILMILGTAMLVPAALDWHDNHDGARVFLHAAIISWFLGGVLYISQRGARAPLSVRHAFLLTVLAWFVTAVIAAIPFWQSDLELTFTDAVFETVSGFTTTGATVLTGLENKSRGLLLWRSMTQFMGGFAVIAFVIILLPLLRVGGMQIYAAAHSDFSDKIMPRTGSLLRVLLLTYLALNGLCMAAYYALGMPAFDAVNHAMTTISTGGFSTRDISFGAFSSAVQWAAVAFMILAGLPFVLYIRLLSQRQWDFHRDPQVRAFLLILAGLILLLLAHLLVTTDMPPGRALRHVVFVMTSILTTTGFATHYLSWTGFTAILILLMTYLGACAGSASGGIKTMRVIIATKALGAQIKRLIHPSGVFVITYDGHALAPKTVYAVLGFLFVYVGANVLLTVGLSLTGLDLETALSAAASAIANVGPGTGAVIGPAGNYAALPDAAKWLLCFGMIAGRLEIMTVLVIFTPHFWQK